MRVRRGEKGRRGEMEEGEGEGEEMEGGEREGEEKGGGRRKKRGRKSEGRGEICE